MFKKSGMQLQFCGVCKISPIQYGKDFVWGMQNFSWERFYVGYAKFLLYSMGKILCGVHKISPIWYGKDFAWGTQNFSYIVWESSMA